MSLKRTRLVKEFSQLSSSFNNENIKLKTGLDSLDIENLLFEVIGPEGTPFATETHQLELKLTERYQCPKYRGCL